MIPVQTRTRRTSGWANTRNIWRGLGLRLAGGSGAALAECWSVDLGTFRPRIERGVRFHFWGGLEPSPTMARNVSGKVLKHTRLTHSWAE